MVTDRWLMHYDSGVPSSCAPYPERTLVDALADASREHPGDAILLFKGARLTYAELQRRSDAFAAALTRLGVQKGDRVALLLPNCPQFCVAQFGAWKIGAVVVPLNPTYSAEELVGPLNLTGARVLVTLTPFYARAKAVQSRTKVETVIATNIKEHLPVLLRLLFTLFKEKKEGHRITLREGDVWMAQLLRRHRGDAPPASRPGPGDTAAILLSGGTTGVPKGVQSPHRGYMIAGRQLAVWLSPALHRGDVLMLPLPLFHTYGHTGVQGLAFTLGCPIALIPNPRDVGDVVKSIESVRPAFLCGVPSLFTALLNHPRVKSGDANFRSIRLCFSGASALLAETRKRFEALTGGRILEGYSLTEAQMAVVANPVNGPNKLGSVGMPLPDVKLRIVDADDETRAVADGEVGEILLTAPQIMPGYWENPEETALMLRRDADGTPWLYTGDLGYLDEDGYLFIVDRKKDMAKIGGFQVWPREVEEVIAKMPEVAEVGVAGVSDAARGEILKAWVVARPGSEVKPEKVRAFCREHLVAYKVPSKVEILDELPKTLVGKVLRRALRDRERARAGLPSAPESVDAAR